MSAVTFGFSSFGVILSVISLAILILSTISSPITSLKLASTSSLDYGVFGYCSGNNCSSVLVPYVPSGLTSLDDTADWFFSDDKRDTLAKMLVVSPVAAGLTLISILIGFMAHFTALTGSSVIFLVAATSSFLAFLASTLFCVISILLFHPHETWLSWLLIPAAVFNLTAFLLYIFSATFASKPESDDLTSFEEQTNLMDFKMGDTSYNYGKDVYKHPLATGKYEDYDDTKNSFTTLDAKSVYTNNSMNHSQQKDFTKLDYSQVPPLPNMNISSNSRSLTGNTSLRPGPNYNGNLGQKYTTLSDESGSKPNLMDGPGSPVQRFVSPNVEPRSATPEIGDLDDQVYGSSSQSGGLPYPINSTVDGNGYQLQGPNQPYPDLAYDHSNTNLNALNADNESDVGSDFTSVSQRAVNPKYYNNKPPSQVSTSSHPYSGMVHQNPQFQYNYQQFSPQFQQHNPQFVQQPEYQEPQQQYYAQPPPQQPPQPQRRVNDSLLLSNPDFMIGGASSKAKRFGPSAAPMHQMRKTKPAFGAASLGRDGPYAGLR